MDSKILTISIAAYNVAGYISETLDSLVSSKYIDELEIFVIDDGGQDDTLTIAKRFQDNFPQSVFPIHKDNGGYGTTVNTSIKKATGKYFKLLDGDDWVVTDELDKLIEKLKDLTCDVVVTPFLKGSDMDNMKIVRPSISFKPEEVCVISEIKNPPILCMWALCYRTEILIESGLELPGRLFYTDQIFCTIPFSVAKTICYFDYSVYCYRIGRDGQSVSKDSRIKNIDMTLDICRYLVRYCHSNENNENYKFMINRVSAYYAAALRTILLLPINIHSLNKFITYEQEIKNISNDVYLSVVSKGKIGKLISLFRKTKYQFYWFLKLLPNGIPNWD